MMMLTLQGTGILHNAFDDGLVSVMHTVESADGDDGIPKIWQMIQAAVYFCMSGKIRSSACFSVPARWL